MRGSDHRPEEGNHGVFISLGSNMGDKLVNCKKGIDLLAESKEICVIKQSAFYKTSPVDYKDQDWFVNGAVKIQTGCDPHALLGILQSIQRKSGRIPGTVQFGPRLLDLDIIFYDDLILHNARLVIPHPRMHQRRFVLRPICDIEPTMIHPALKKTVQDLLEQVTGHDQKIIKIDE